MRRRRAMAAVLVAAAVLGGCQGRRADPSAVPLAVPAPAAASTAAPTVPPAAASTVPPAGAASAASESVRPSPPPTGPIPDAALLQPTDLHGAETLPMEHADEQRPHPCAGGRYDSDSLRTGARAIVAFYRSPGTPPGHLPASQVREFVAVYLPEGSGQFLGELRTAVSRCGAADGRSGRWEIVGTGGWGDEALFIRITRRYEQPPGYPRTDVGYLAAVRVGRAVVLVEDAGYEGAGGEASRCRRWTTEAAWRVRGLA